MPDNYPHIILKESPETTLFKSISSGGGEKRIPSFRDRRSHSSRLKQKLAQAWADTQSEQVVHHTTRKGVYLEFKGETGFDLVTKSLEDLKSKKVRLLNVRKESSKPAQFSYDTRPEDITTFATVFVDNEKKELFFNKIEQYAGQETASGKPKHSDLINSISDIRKADAIESFWLDDKALIPKDEPGWCEVWLRAQFDENISPSEIVDRFDKLIQELEIQSKSGFIKFPERIVKVILVNQSQLEKLALYSDDIAEYRHAKETAGFWTEMKNVHQAEWTDDLQDRIKVNFDSDTSVCILDTGVNNGHPLLNPLLSDDDCQTVNPEWGTHAHHKHGTLMAGVAAFGDLAACLAGQGTVEIKHCLESVKIFLTPQQTEPDLWGYITSQGISRAEIQAPHRNRIVCMGISSEFSTTSHIWDDMWPIKPEIVMEGGNFAIDECGFGSECDDLSLLSTYYKPQESYFYPFRMTSASTAYAAWFAAKIQSEYPNFWPETLRAIMVHSAQWPENLKKQFTKDDRKTSLKRLMRICGYGVPNLQDALYSAANSLTLIAQQTIQPFDKKDKGSGYRTKDMHLYQLPWPKETLLALPSSTFVEMRITLSYFIEPGPGEIGWKDRYRYASHGLRFHLNSPGEPQEDFVKRVNAAARLEDEGKPDTKSASDHWVIGSQTRNKGSIHSDIWKGTAAELADSNMISVSPTIGWWRERAYLGKWDKKTRYALVVTIKTPEEKMDIYTPVATKIGVKIPIPISI